MRLSARLLLASNRLFRPLPRPHHCERDYFQHTHNQARDRAKQFAEHFDLTGKRMLDLGCGLGAKAIYHAKHSPVREVVGVDLNPDRIAMARKWAESEGIDPARLSFEVGDGSRMPFEDDSFDVLLNEDVIEHIVDVPNFLSECLRILKPGGALLMRGGPFFHSPGGAHMRYQFGIPWVGVLFSRDAIAEASATLPEPKGVFLTSTPAQEIEQFDELNRITPRTLTRLVDESGFQRHLWKWGPKKARPLGCLPIIGKYFTASLTAVLIKPGGTRA